ncbi:hypothetical protein NLG97_g2369 [Lecanicillium saksenae]|uniref:Uncharacterized protein n=1 Tax=Lecanicillium saksenae TaxID=468837 RepID=A0ACC1R4I5_9HYPO|nr:hypothetical protein NLG97_g2369 [Lecanicillium saksenae]
MRQHSRCQNSDRCRHEAATQPSAEVKAIYQIGWQSNATGNEVDYYSLIGKLRDYLANGHAAVGKETMLYASYGNAAAGFYFGRSLRSHSGVEAALESLEIKTESATFQRDTLSMQLCDSGYDSGHIFGIALVRSKVFADVQETMKTWDGSIHFPFTFVYATVVPDLPLTLSLTLHATDLEQYNKPFTEGQTWPQILKEIDNNVDPYLESGPHHGNWTKLTCDDYWSQNFTEPESKRWSGLDVNDARQNMTTDWKNWSSGDKAYGFSAYIARYVGRSEVAECGKIGHNYCAAFGCRVMNDPAQEPIWTCLAQISAMYNTIYDAVVSDAALRLDSSFSHMEDVFAPKKPPDEKQWLDTLLGLVSLGAPMIPELGKLSKEGAELGKKITGTLASGAVSIASTFKDSDASTWKAEDQHKFSNYMAKCMSGWGQAIKTALADFDGHFAGPLQGGMDDADLNDQILQAVYAFGIPALWKASHHQPLIVDTGKGCGEDDDDIHTKGLPSACHDGTLYKLVAPDGKGECVYSSPPCDCNHGSGVFKVPTGADKLGEGDWGGVTTDTLIKGAVKTYLSSGKDNDAPETDPKEPNLITGLLQGDATTAGFIRFPVCDENQALKSWKTAQHDEHIKERKNFPRNDVSRTIQCGPSTFVDQTSDASPPTGDCNEMLQELVDEKDSSWTTFEGTHRKIRTHGKCIMNVYTSIGGKSARYYIGHGDGIEILKEAIDKFGGSGKVGAKGTMRCSGDSPGTNEVT